MKLTRFLLGAVILLAPVIGLASETAQARMYCFSPRFQRSQDQQTTFYTLDLTTLTVGVNGELAYGDFFNSGDTHSTFLVLTDQLFQEEYDGAMALNVPSGGDANGNSYPDFFEVSQPVTASTTGAYNISGFGSGSVTASWSRGAGSQLGVCVLTLKSTPFGDLTFSPIFELIEYTGPIVYTPGSNIVSGTVNLTQTGNPANQMQGPVQFVKKPTDRFNQLTLQPGGWTNAALQSITFTNDLFVRVAPWTTNYGGYVDFDDWDPNTPDPDYVTWGMSIDDTNDFNHNSIPDFSDDPASALPRRPLLSLAFGPTNLSITIRGDVGHLHQVQESLQLPPTNWLTVTSLTLATDPQTVSLPVSAARTRFWRVLAR